MRRSGGPWIVHGAVLQGGAGADGLRGPCALVDAAGNWIRFFRDGNAQAPLAEASRWDAAVQNAVVLERLREG